MSVSVTRPGREIFIEEERLIFLDLLEFSRWSFFWQEHSCLVLILLERKQSEACAPVRCVECPWLLQKGKQGLQFKIINMYKSPSKHTHPNFQLMSIMSSVPGVFLLTCGIPIGVGFKEVEIADHCTMCPHGNDMLHLNSTGEKKWIRHYFISGL